MVAAQLEEGSPDGQTEDGAWRTDWLRHLMLAPATILTAEGTLTQAASRLTGLPLEDLISERDAQGAAVSVEGEIALYRGWIAGNPGSPLLPGAWFNLGVGLARSGQRDAAIRAYQAALAIRPDFHVAAVNLGLLYESGGQADEALSTWTGSIQPAEARIALQTQAGRLLEARGRHQAAEAIFAEILALDPAQADVRHHWLHLRQKTCLWPVMPPGSGASLAQSGPFGIMALTDDIAAQHATAAAWIARKTSPAPRLLAPDRPYSHDRLRIGYLSSDFCSHAMAYLIAEVFERHDRARVTVYGYCSTLEDHSPVRRRLLAAFDEYRPIRSLSDEDAARLIREDEIDILVDLNGITDGSRLAVLRWRPAPVQASYLGFVGPVPLPELDYLFCDAVVIPPEYAAAYGTRPLPIGPIYQANDSKRAIGPALTRAEEGLPQDRFILACFSKHYKITQEVFAAWMAILEQVPHAVLWLTQDNADSQRNLQQAAARAGIGAERLIFSERVDPAKYMSRFQLADLFLDTFPYNAGTVASDALRMGLPLVTLCGRAFASRMATSLLHAMDTHEGIATSLAQYVEIVIRLARDDKAYRQFRARFNYAAWRHSIGNIEGFMEAYETSLLRLVQTETSEDQEDEARRGQDYPSPGPDWGPQADRAFQAGLACSLAGDHAGAAAHYRAAIACKPDHVQACLNLGTAVLALGQREAAVAFYRKAIEHDAANAMAYGNLGKALHDLGRFEAATEALERAIALNPDSGINDINLSATLMARALWEEARIAAERAIARMPATAMAYCNLGKCLINLGRWDQATEIVAQALALQPDDPIIQTTLGGMMIELGQWQAAIPLLSQAVSAAPDLASGWFNLSHAYRGLNRFDDAAAAIETALALKPDEPDYHFHLAHLLLLRGDFARGWAEYEWRWRLPGFTQPHPDIARWQGQPLAGHSILVTPEQGLGDIIQAARYLPGLAAEARRVMVVVPTAAQRLLQTIPGIEIVAPDDPAVMDCDVTSPIMSLPWALSRRAADPTPAVPMPYLQAAAEECHRWHRLLPQQGLRVGLVWAGNPAAQRDRFRSPGLAAVRPLLAEGAAHFVLLQMGPGRADLTRLSLPTDVLDLGEEIADLADTAAIMTGLDLVISSCTAPLHLAGALGVPAWGIIPFTPHFTWGPQGTQSACYPSVRLYRQSQPGRDWSDVVTRMVSDLRDLARSHEEAARVVAASCPQSAAR